MERCRDALSETEQKPSMHKIFFGKGSKPAPMGKEWPFNGYIKIGEERHKKIKIKEPHPSKTNRKPGNPEIAFLGIYSDKVKT